MWPIVLLTINFVQPFINLDHNIHKHVCFKPNLGFERERERERERFTNILTKELLTDHWNGFAFLLHMSLKTISCLERK